MWGTQRNNKIRGLNRITEGTGLQGTAQQTTYVHDLANKCWGQYFLKKIKREI